MKKLIFLALIASSFFYSCKKEDSSPVSKSGYTAKVDGNFWRAAKINASIFNGTIVVIAQASNGMSITFSLNGDSTGLYPLNENTNSSASFSLKDINSKNFTSGGSPDAGGQILIESISKTDNKLTGSIEFKAVRPADDSTITISEGRFVDISYDNIPIGIEDNTLKAKVAGSNWSPQNVSGFVAFKTIYLQAIDADNVRVLTFELPELIGPGTYTLNYFTNYKAVYTNVAGKNHYAVNGNLTVLSHNLVSRRIEATFDMLTEAYESGGTIRFTEGEIDIVYE